MKKWGVWLLTTLLGWSNTIKTKMMTQIVLIVLLLAIVVASVPRQLRWTSIKLQKKALLDHEGILLPPVLIQKGYIIKLISQQEVSPLMP